MYCIETHNRIQLLMAAYAYEILNEPRMTDAEYDALANQIQVDLPTTRPDLDTWFKENFVPYTSVWIYTYPELDRLGRLCKLFKPSC